MTLMGDFLMTSQAPFFGTKLGLPALAIKTDCLLLLTKQLADSPGERFGGAGIGGSGI